MYINKIKIENYKSILSTEELDLSKGFNIIVGENNVGKTAFIEAISLKSGMAQHKSPETMPTESSPLEGFSEVNISFILEGDQFLDAIMKIPYPVAVPIRHGDEASALQNRFESRLTQEHTITASFRNGGGVSMASDKDFPFFPYTNPKDQGSMYNFEIGSDGKIKGFLGKGSGTVGKTYAAYLAAQLKSRIYAYKAERYNVGHCESQSTSILKEDASNLAAVLNRLRTVSTAYGRYVDSVKYVFPQIKDITIKPEEQHNVRILIWTDNPAEEREHLAFSLSESGTGIGQVLAMLYVVLTNNKPMIIIIDEPQSFLHPGAIRRLFEVFKENLHHQYIISTHSPTVISSATPSSIYLLRKENFETKIKRIDAAKKEELRICLLELGASLSDVFGADNILWVEGKTEEICFPLLLPRIKKDGLNSIKFIGVRSPGDFLGKRKQWVNLVFDTYDSLSNSGGLIPPAIGYIFDRETLSETELEDLKRKGKGKVSFTKRRMFENYLLYPKAVATVINEINSPEKEDVSEEEIAKWWEKNKKNPTYLPPRESTDEYKTDEGILRKIHGAKVLSRLFEKFSDTDFNKIRHNPKLTEWLIENKGDHLKELQDLLSSVLSN